MKDAKVKAAYKTVFGGDFRFFAAPGRINILGEHTDYNNGFVLPAAIDKRMYLAISAVEGQQATICSVDYDQTARFDLRVENAALPHWALYPFGVVRELRKSGVQPGAFVAAFGGDIPEGAGLSSSAALESVFAYALNTLFKLGLDAISLARIGQMAEHNYAGVQCGIMDQFASLHGKSGHAVKLDCRSLEFDYIPLKMKDYAFILADTRVKHSLSSSEYNRRRFDCEEGVMVLRTQMPGVKSLRDVRSKDVYPYKGILGEQVFLCCEYVTEENERVLEACKALINGDLTILGELMFQTHEGLRSKYDVSCDELDLLVNTATSTNGVIGARMMGGGFGGCTLNLVHISAIDRFKQSAIQVYKRQFGNEPLFYEVQTGDGACEL